MTSNSSKTDRFVSDVQKQLAKIATKHGFKLPKFNSFEIDGAIFLNVTAFNEIPDKVYAKWYKQNCKAIGLNENLLNQKFFYKESSSYLSIIGIDPDGGERCIRVRDEKGTDFHMHPLEVKRAMLI